MEFANIAERRNAVWDLYCQGKSYAEISSSLGLPKHIIGNDLFLYRKKYEEIERANSMETEELSHEQAIAAPAEEEKQEQLTPQEIDGLIAIVRDIKSLLTAMA